MLSFSMFADPPRTGRERGIMEFRLLGPVTFLRADRAVSMRSRKVSELLAVLLVSAGHRASHAEVMRYLWPGESLKQNRIRQNFHQLRLSVPEICSESNERGFCRIHVQSQDLDHLRFRGLLRAADSTRDSSVRLKSLRDAIGEWRGIPLEGLQGAAFERKRHELMTELREATIACVLAELECSQSRAALDRADSALTHWPTSEALLELKVRALRTLGRQDEIPPLLAEWERECGRSTAHLLLADTSGEHDRGSTNSLRTMAPPRPRQLPLGPLELVGRRRWRDRLTEVLLGRVQGRSRLAALSGMPGVGKSALAVEVAVALDQYFADGILHVDLGGVTPEGLLRHEHVIARLLNDLGVRPATPTLDGMVSAYRTALADRAVLLILDNARDEEHVRPLLPPAGPSAAIVTGRRHLHGLEIREDAELIALEPLDRADATELLRVRLGEDRMRTAAPFVADIVEHCSGLPLALGIMAARITRRPARALSDMVRELRVESTRLRSLDLGSENLSVRLSLDASHRQLSAPASRLLRRLAIHPGPTISWAALRAIAPEDEVHVSEATDELLRMSLVTEPSFERYALHDLVRVHAEALTCGWAQVERNRVVKRVLHFLMHHAWACDRRLEPGRRLPIDRPGTLRVMAPADAAEAMKWFEAEYSTLTAAVGLAQRHGLDRYTWLLSMTLVTFQWRSDRHLDALAGLTRALPAATRESGPADVAMVHRMLAGTHRAVGNAADAVRELNSAVRISDDDGDMLGAALGRHALGVLVRESGAPGEALEHFGAALSAFEELHDTLGQGAVLNGIGSARYDLGHYEEAVEHCLRSLSLLAGTGDINGQAHAHFSLGRIRMAQADPETAVAELVRARVLYRSLTYGSREARTLVLLAKALRAAGRATESAEAMGQARAVLRRVGEMDIDAALDRLARLP
ncbi:BTAD domain-containing putative transcriptional regulator [Streptomyces sp. NPDC057539]|uniref:AfsR/SARP family transcriptional regulator n=1 Tax=Streptomyces sp. NPDC057539 TaxID=3346159 RepID=UPI0036A95D61